MRLRHVLLAAIVAALSGCSSDEDETSIVLTGSSTIAPLASELGKRFEALHPRVRVDVQTGGSSRGIADARSELADLGMASRALYEDEHDLKAYTIAYDGVGIIVHRDNPVRKLTDKQISGIYTGEIANWNEVGGRDAPITVVNKAEGRSTLELFLEYFTLESSDIEADVVIGDNEQGIKTVAGNPDSIGYVSIGTAEYDAGQGVPIKLLPLSGVDASTANVRNGTFPLSRPLNLVKKTRPQGWVRRFVDFARSPAARNIVTSQFFVPIAQ